LREERKLSQEKLADNIVKLAHGLNVRPIKLVEAIR